MNTPALSHLIYASSASPGFDAADLTAILNSARVKNARLDVTGMLLYTSGSFFQVLEGEDSVLNELIGTIAADPRHNNVTKIIEEPISERDFADWTMGFSEIKISDLKLIDGLSDFFQRGESFTSLPAGRAKKLLAAFADGRWRLQGNKL
jgi:Sensors of blue-light using FAD